MSVIISYNCHMKISVLQFQHLKQPDVSQLLLQEPEVYSKINFLVHNNYTYNARSLSGNYNTVPFDHLM